MLSDGGSIFDECIKPDFLTARATVAACIKNDGVEPFRGNRPCEHRHLHTAARVAMDQKDNRTFPERPAWTAGLRPKPEL